jgi:hypothetical protein
MNAPPASPSDNDGNEGYTDSTDSMLCEFRDSGNWTENSSEGVIDFPPRQGSSSPVSPLPPRTERPTLPYEQRLKQDCR